MILLATYLMGPEDKLTVACRFSCGALFATTRDNQTLIQMQGVFLTRTHELRPLLPIDIDKGIKCLVGNLDSSHSGLISHKNFLFSFTGRPFYLHMGSYFIPLRNMFSQPQMKFRDPSNNNLNMKANLPFRFIQAMKQSLSLLAAGDQIQR